MSETKAVTLKFCVRHTTAYNSAGSVQNSKKIILLCTALKRCLLQDRLQLSQGTEAVACSDCY